MKLRKTTKVKGSRDLPVSIYLYSFTKEEGSFEALKALETEKENIIIPRSRVVVEREFSSTINMVNKYSFPNYKNGVLFFNAVIDFIKGANTVVVPGIEKEVFEAAKGDYQRGLLNGYQSWAGSDLGGKALKYSYYYKISRENLKERIKSRFDTICVHDYLTGRLGVLIGIRLEEENILL